MNSNLIEELIENEVNIMIGEELSCLEGENMEQKENEEDQWRDEDLIKDDPKDIQAVKRKFYTK